MDPAYLDMSESTGGQLFLFQKDEVAHASVAMNASHTHPDTVLRAVGMLSGSRDFEFPVDSTTGSFLVLASLQCSRAIAVSRPNGTELTAANSAQSIDLKSGRILRVDSPEAGKWKVRLAGTGLFVLSVLARTRVSLAGVAFYAEEDPSREPAQPARLARPLFGVRQKLEAHLAGEVSNVRFLMVGPSGDVIADLGGGEAADDGTFRIDVTPAIERFRILATGRDAGGWPLQRTDPILYRAEQSH